MKLRHIDTAILLLIGLFVVAPALQAAERVSAAGPAERTGQYIDDATLTTRVKVTLLSDDLLSAFEVKVRSDRGIVTLSGEVDKAETIQRAIKLASGIPGVKAINTHLMVKVASYTVSRSDLKI